METSLYRPYLGPGQFSQFQYLGPGHFSQFRYLGPGQFSQLTEVSRARAPALN